jgi:hypothetical protein
VITIFGFHVNFTKNQQISSLFSSVLQESKELSSFRQIFTVILTKHHWYCEFESRSGWGVQHYVHKVCQWLATDRWFSPVTPVSSIIKTDCHDITEILMKAALNTIGSCKSNNHIFTITTPLDPFVFRIDRRLIYTDQINKDFLHYFMFSLYSISFYSGFIKSSSKMAENMQGYDKKSRYFLGRHCL